MARIRSIKPEFWSDDTITECSVSARLLFIGMWNFADDAGNLDRSHKQIKARVFPVDAIKCEPLIQELLTHGLLIEYSVSGQKYLHIPGFAKHQLINRPSKPVVPGYEESLRTHVILSEPSLNTHDGLEGKGGDRKGKDKDPSASATPTHNANGKRVTVHTECSHFIEIKSIYPKRAGDQGWSKAFRACNARLAEGSTWDELIAGTKRYAQFCEATEKTGTEFVKQAATFFGPDRHYAHSWQLPPSKAQQRQDQNLAATEQWLIQQEVKDAQR
jgi:hypothetical protein